MKHFPCLELHGYCSLLLDELVVQNPGASRTAGRQLARQAAALSRGRQLGLEPVWPLSPVALVDKVGALQQVAGPRHDRSFGQVEESGDEQGVGHGAGHAGLQQEVKPVHARLDDVHGHHVTLEDVGVVASGEIAPGAGCVAAHSSRAGAADAAATAGGGGVDDAVGTGRDTGVAADTAVGADSGSHGGTSVFKVVRVASETALLLNLGNTSIVCLICQVP